MSDRRSDSAVVDAAQGEAVRAAGSRRGVGVKILLAVFAAVFALLLCEVCVRLVLPVTDSARMMWDPLLGVRHAPNQSGRFVRGRTIRGDFHFNAEGWNSAREYSAEKAPGEVRVCLLGDSEAEGMYVPNEFMMSAVAERAMERPGRPVTWYPFACTGFGTLHEYLTLEHKVWRYQPDAVIVLFVDNDVYDSSPYLGTVVKTSPAFLLDVGGGLRLIEPEAQEFSFWSRVAMHSGLYRFLKLQRHFGTAEVDPNRPPVFLREGAGDPERSYDFGAGLTPAEQGEKSWALIEAMLAGMKAACDERGVPFGVAYRGCRPEVYRAWDGRSYDPPLKELDPWCLRARIFEMGREHLGPICARHGIEFLDLTDTLIASVKQTGRRHDFVEDTHLNVESHRAVGAALARMAERMLADDDPRANP